MFEVYMTWNLNYFSIFEQYSFPVGFREDFEKYCATRDSVQQTTLVFLSISTALLTSVWHPCQHRTSITHILLRYKRQHFTNATHPTHASTLPTLAYQPRQLAIIHASKPPPQHATNENMPRMPPYFAIFNPRKVSCN